MVVQTEAAVAEKEPSPGKDHSVTLSSTFEGVIGANWNFCL